MVLLYITLDSLSTRFCKYINEEILNKHILLYKSFSEINY